MNKLLRFLIPSLAIVFLAFFFLAPPLHPQSSGGNRVTTFIAQTWTAIQTYTKNVVFCGPSPYIDPTCSLYGAKGDGSNIDASAIQAAENAAEVLAAAGFSGGKLQFPAGIYLLGNTPQGNTGALLTIRQSGILWECAGSSNSDDAVQFNPSCRLLMNSNATLASPPVALTAIANASHTTGKGGTFSSVENNTAGGTVPANTYGFAYTFENPYKTTDATITNIALTTNVVTITAANTLAVGDQVRINGVTTSTYLNGQMLQVVTRVAGSFTANFTHADDATHADTGTARRFGETTASATTYITTSGATSAPIVYSPDYVGNVLRYKTYICSGAACDPVANGKLYQLASSCSNLYATYTPPCWIGDNLNVTTDPGAQTAVTPPLTSSMTAYIGFLLMESAAGPTTKFDGAPTLRGLEFRASSNNNMGFGFHDHAGGQGHYYDLDFTGGGMSTPGSTAMWQSGWSAPGANAFANETRIAGNMMTKPWHGMRLFPTGSVLGSYIDMNLADGACTLNVSPDPVGNCQAGFDSMGRTSVGLSSSHVDIGAGTNSVAILANGTNNLGTSSSPTVFIATGLRVEGGGCSGCTAVKALSSGGLDIDLMCTLGSGNTCFFDDAGSTRNRVAVSNLPGSNVTVFNSSGTFDVLTNGRVAAINAARFNIGGGTAMVAGDWAFTSGWSTSSKATPLGTDEVSSITVTGAGTPSLNPVLTETFHDGTFGTAPLCHSSIIGGTGAVSPIPQLLDTPNATTDAITFVGTPAAGSTYVFQTTCRGWVKQ